MEGSILDYTPIKLRLTVLFHHYIQIVLYETTFIVIVIVIIYPLAVKKEDKTEKVIQRDPTMNHYLTRVDDGDVKKEKEHIDREQSILDRAQNDSVFKNKVERGPKELEIGNLKKMTKSLEVSKILSTEKEHLRKGNETFNKVVEETIEETEILSKDAEVDGSDVKEELISEEIIEIEPEGEVLNEHSYAFTSSYKEEELKQLKEEEVVKEKEKSPSPVIDVVNINDEKTLVSKRLEPKAIFPMRNIDHENSIVWNVLREGIDSEDLKYLKTAFESLHVFGSNVVKDHHWSHHPGIIFNLFFSNFSLSTVSVRFISYFKRCILFISVLLKYLRISLKQSEGAL